MGRPDKSSRIVGARGMPAAVAAHLVVAATEAATEVMAAEAAKATAMGATAMKATAMEAPGRSRDGSDNGYGSCSEGRESQDGGTGVLEGTGVRELW